MPHVVLVAEAAFLDDQLSVVQDESTHDGKPDIQVSLWMIWGVNVLLRGRKVFCTHLKDEAGSYEDVGQHQDAQH